MERDTNKLPELKITKGEWDVNNSASTAIKVHGLECSEIFTHQSEDDLGEWIAYVRGNTEAERIANAKLIAAAPDMLHALEEAFKELRFHNWHNTNTGMLIERTIKQAKGEE